MFSVLVTGASGFVGRSTVRTFLNRGWRVRAAVRELPADAESNVEWRAVGDIEQSNAWQGIADGLDCIVHLAARAHILRRNNADELARFRAVNVDPTARLASEAARSGVRRFIFLSSVGVNGRQTLRAPFKESDAPQPCTPYALSKWEAEQKVQEIASANGVEWVIVRAPLVYGPAAPGNFGRLAKWVVRGWPLPFECIRNRRSMIYIENLTHALVQCASEPGAATQLFLVADDTPVSTPELISRMGAVIGRPARLWPAPEFLLRIVAAVSNPWFSFSSLIDSLEIDSTHIRNTIGWVAPYSLQEGLKRTVRK